MRCRWVRTPLGCIASRSASSAVEAAPPRVPRSANSRRRVGWASTSSPPLSVGRSIPASFHTSLWETVSPCYVAEARRARACGDDGAETGHGVVATQPRMNADARLVDAHEFFRKGQANAEGWSMLIARGRGWEHAYRDRWRHDKVVRSTHGVNCTGSCSWNVYVKDGLITWESQAVDYPRTDPDRPNHEPRGCPRGASFSWYTYSPVRLRYPYVRGSLLERWRAAKATAPDPVAAFAEVAAEGGY